MHGSSVMTDAGCADVVLWGPGDDAYSLPANPAWHMQWLPSVPMSAHAT